MVVRVAVNGYGTIGKRVADAVAAQSDLKLVGVAKTKPNYEAEAAVQKGYPLFVAPPGQVADFRKYGLEVAGTSEEMIGAADVIVDAAPDKVGRENRRMYDAAGVRAVFQGGEKPDVAEVSFSALANFAEALGKKRVRVVSCNTTGLARAAAVLDRRWGVERWDATIIRRAADPPESKRGPINGILPSLHIPSHHGPDVRTIFPKLPIITTAVVVPTTLMHVHVNHVRLREKPADVDEIVDAFRATPRFHLFAPWEAIDGTPQVMEFARDRIHMGRNDVMENVLWEEGVHLEDRDLHFFQAIHQESIVVPENVDAIRAMFELERDPLASVAKTDRALGIPSSGGRKAS
jgi:glyceraldehyde-3-phosphate dehydrogenase (NAD(P))